MHVARLKLWNFRKYGSNNEMIDLNHPHLDICFKPKMNVLIGENDSGKTAIIDALRIVLKTHTNDRYWINDDDFFDTSSALRIEVILEGMTDTEASHFTEWLEWENNNPSLRLIFTANRNNKGIRVFDTMAGSTENGSTMPYEAKSYLCTTYLKPLRNAEDEMAAKKGSRLSQILNSHNLFKAKDGEKHEFEEYIEEANCKIEHWFENDNHEEGIKSNKEQIKDIVDSYLHLFVSDGVTSSMTISNPAIRSILEKITLDIKEQRNPGLGTLNRLYMAAELLHLSKGDWTGLKTCLIEELEAHLHPQAQMKVIDSLQKENSVQYIITTHSPNLASKINISDDSNTNIILCKEHYAYPLCPGTTKLSKPDYKYLEHFLDATKSNLFFAKGIILVEGWAEDILIPVIADKLGKNITKNEVSIINVGSTAYLHFAKIFMPSDGTVMNYPVSIVTDLDVQPNEKFEFDTIEESSKLKSKKQQIECTNYPNIVLSVAHKWTLEWCLYNSSSYSDIFKQAVAKVHSRTAEFQKDENGNWKEAEFKTKLREMLLPNAKSKLDKVQVAHNLANLIDSENKAPEENDVYIKYIIDAINHVCQ